MRQKKTRSENTGYQCALCEGSGVAEYVREGKVGSEVGIRCGDVVPVLHTSLFCVLHDTGLLREGKGRSGKGYGVGLGISVGTMVECGMRWPWWAMWW